MTAEKPTRPPATRRIEKQIEVAAPIEAVWKALTDAQQLTRWFPLEAQVVPGEGGSIFLSWGPDCQGKAPITAWEVNRRRMVLESEDSFAIAKVRMLKAQANVSQARQAIAKRLQGSSWF